MTNRRLRISRLSYSQDSGFTIIEVMVAILILLVGVLGTVALIDGANRATVTTKAREGGVALTREVAEVARLLDFDALECATETCSSTDKATVALQAQQELADTAPGGAWTVERRGFTYTISGLSVCKVDVDQDGINAGLRDASYCSSGQGLVGTGTADPNPDDYHRIRVTVNWTFGSGTRSVSQTALISNPTGGLGPRISCFGYGFAIAAGCTNPAPNPTVTAGNSVTFKATTTFASSFNWEADNNTKDALTGGGATWAFDWPIGNVPASWPVGASGFDCGDGPANWTLDGTYLMSGQAFNDLGIPGQQRSVNVRLARSLPSEPCDLAGGFNNRGGVGPPVIDLQWNANKERDIQGYRVYRGSITPANQVCPSSPTGVPLAPGASTSATSCFIATPGVDDNYFVVAVDCNATSQVCEGPSQAGLAIPAVGVTNQPANPPTGVSAATSGATTVITWTAPSPVDPDGGDTVLFYRIYRGTGGSAYSDRYSVADCCTFQDNAPDATKTQYFVSTVDQDFAESTPVGPVTP